MTEPPEFAIVACRPVDINDVPSAARAEFVKMEENAPLGEGWTTGTCVVCDMRVKIGPRQLAKMAERTTSHVVMDMMCAAKAVKMSKQDIPIRGLGGK